MKILLAQNMLYIPTMGGANKANRLLVEGLVERQHSCRVVAPAIGSHGPKTLSQFREQLAAQGINLSPSSNGADVFGHKGVEIHAVREATQLRSHLVQQIREFNPDWTVVSSQDPGQVLLEAALRECPGRVVYMVHAPWDLPFGSSSVFTSAASTELIRQTAAIVTVSNYLKDYIRRGTNLESTVIACPVYGSGPFPNYGTFDRGFVTMVNPSAIKGISIFLALAQQFPKVQFAAVPTWATTGADQRVLEQLSNVQLLQPFENIDDLFAQTRVLLVPSLWEEAFGLIVVEAMLRGIPVLASDVGGLPEAKLGVDYVLPVRPVERYEERFDDRNYPIPVVPEQDMRPWKDALRELLSDRQRYEQISNSSREAAHTFVSRAGIGPFAEFLAGLIPPKQPEQSKMNAVVDSPRELLNNISPEKRALLALRALQLKKKSNGSVSQQTIPRRAHPDSPLSFAQLRLWFLDQLDPHSAAYNLPTSVRMSGALNIDALEQTFTELLRRHEILRTSFRMFDDEPRQVIAAPAPFHLPLLDLTERSVEEREAELRRLANDEAQRPFNLAHGPLLRATLVRIAAEDHALLFTTHHIVSDGWSIGLLIKEVSSLYAAFCSGGLSPLPELPIQYADYAVWQRERLTGEVLANELAYWREQLGEELPVLELPTDYPRPVVQSHRGAHHTVVLSQQLTEGLKAVSGRAGATLFMTLLAAWQTLLSRYSRQDQIVVGTPIAGRNRAETEGLIGFFLNSLVLRTDLSGDPIFLELLGRVRSVALGAYAHQEMPFEKLVEELQPERDTGRSPLFQVMLVLQNAPRSGGGQVAGLGLQFIQAAQETVNFDLTLELMETGGGLVGTLGYNVELFKAETIGRMVQHLELLLESVVQQPEQRLSELELVSAAEREQILVGWNETAAEYPRDKGLAELFEEQVARTPEAIAVVHEEEALTYAELNARANQLAHYLHSLGVGPEVLVGICVERSVAMMVGLLGILKAGGAYVPLDPSYPQERLAYMLADARLSVLVTQEALLEVLPVHEAQTFCLDSEWTLTNGYSTANPCAAVTPNNLAYVIYTSGSTGRPKGVQIAQRGVVNLLEAMRRGPGLESDDVLLAVTTLSFDIAALELFLPLLVGARLVVVSRETAADGAQLRKQLEASGATVMQATPATWRLLQEAGWTGTPGLQIWCGGEALLPALAQQLRELGAAVWNLYGPTETTIWSSACEVTEVETAGASVSIGRPLANTQLYVLDGQLRPVPVGVLGELYIGGDGLARGYLGQAELTAEKFVPHPFASVGGERLYRTGDLARYLETGALEYVGRVDQQVKVRGYRIEVGEIEVALNAHEAVREAVVVARAGADGEKRLVVYVVAEGVETRELQQHVSSRLPAYMVPSVFVLLEQLPLTPNGKVDRRALPAPELGRANLGGAYVAARTPSEEVLAGIWATVLRVEQVGVYDNFFALGGHSLLATQVMSRVREAFGVEVPVRALFEHPTVSGLAAVVEEMRQGGVGLEAPPLVAVERSGELVLSYAQQRLWFLDQLEPNSSFYNIPAAVRLKGALDLAALEESFAEIVRRHESLRTRFSISGNEPIQVIDEAGEFRLQVTDLSELEADELEAVARRAAQEEAHEPFELAVGPLFRARVLRLGAEDYVLLCTMHHIVSDGWSMGILIKELTALYEAFSQGQSSPLPELTIQYADFAQWQRGWLHGELLDEQLNYWKRQLAGAPAVLELPLDHARPAVQSFRGAQQAMALSAPASVALRELSQRHGVTLFMTLLAAWQLLLSRYSGQSDIVVGTPIAGRNHAETEALIGFFINTLVLRTDLSGDPSFIELLGRVREVALGAYAHQDVPFEKLVEELQPERDRSRSPLFQVMLVLQNVPQEPTPLPGLQLSAVEGVGVTTKFDLTLSVTESAAGLVGMVGYNTDLFEGASIARMMRQFEVLLEQVGRHAEQRLSELQLMRPEEREQLLVQWNETAVEYPAEQCIHELFAAQVERTPEAVAVVYEAEALTYAELNARANQLAHYLQSWGVGPEVLVGLCVERSVQMVVGLLGILKAGGAYVPLDPSYPQERLAYMLADAQVSVLLTQEALLEALPPLAVQTFCVDSEWALIDGQSTTNPSSSVTVNNLAYVIYTSGSTGRPKGVQVEHRGIANLALAQARAFRLSEASRVLQFASLSFDAAVSELFKTWLSGGTLCLAPARVLLPGQGLLELLHEQQITAVTLPPSVLAVLPPVELPALETIIAAGEACSAELAARWGAGRQFCNAYGPTETTVCATINAAVSSDGRKPSIGKAMANMQVYILDAAMQPAPVGVSGELYVGGVGVARGYLNRSDLTAERFVPDPYGPTAGARLYRTGDLARFRGEGEIEYLGRIDNQVKVRGFRIELGEIEAALLCCEQVCEAAVLALADADGERRLVAYVVSEGEGEPSQLSEYLASLLPQYMLPSAFVMVEQMPLTLSGKLDRRALPAPGAARRSLAVGFVAAETPLQQLLVDLWQQTLLVDQVGIHDNFFAIGGDSIRAAIFINKLQQLLGEYLYVVALFDAPTIAELAAYLEVNYAQAVARWSGGSAHARAANAEAVIDAAHLAHFRSLIPPAPALPAMPEKLGRAVFILSAPRSGSTLLRVMLAGHPELFAPPELELLGFTTLAERAAELSGRNAFWREGLVRALMQLRHCDAEQAQELTAAWEAEGLSVGACYGQLQQWLGERLLVDKTPSYALDLAVLQRAEELFTEPLYVHLVRDPRSMIGSFEEAKLDQVFFRPAHELTRRQLAELIWVTSEQNIAEFLSEVSKARQLVVRYEDLVREPQREAQRLSAFVGLEAVAGMMDPYAEKDERMTDGIHPLSKMMGDVKFHEHAGIEASGAEKWRERPVGELWEGTWAVAARHGYQREASENRLGELVRAERSGELVLSYAQQRLWFLDQLEPGSIAYNIPTAVRLKGALHVAALEQSFAEVIRRHESLRTRFAVVAGVPVQVIDEAGESRLQVTDLSELGECEVEARRLARAEAQEPFDLAVGPLFRARVLRLGAEDHVLLCTMHHIVSDGWSMGILIKELTALYEAFTQGQSSPLPELRIQYADFAQWQRSWLQGEVLERQLSYWKQQLDGVSAALELPTDYVRPAVQSFRGAQQVIVLSSELTAGLKELSRREGVTLFMTVLAGWQLLLSRYSGQQDIVVGTAIAGRNRAETEALIGFFVNTLVLRTELTGDLSFVGLLGRVREVALGAYAHQDVPFEKLVEELQPERDLSRSPLFQVLLLLQNAPQAAAQAATQLRGLELSAVTGEAGAGMTVKYDLTLELTESGAGLVGTLGYNVELFKAETIGRMVRHFELLLEQVVQQPEQRLSELELVSAAEREQILVGWNETAAEYPRDKNLAELFEAQVARTPEAIAVVHEEEAVTYAELNARANQLAHYLQTLGVGAETLVGICMERSVAMMVGLLGILKAGGAYVPLDPRYPQERLAYMLADAQLTVLLTQTQLLEALPQHEAQTVCLDAASEELEWQSTANPRTSVTPNNLAYVIYTSGSTGRPKGVQIAQRGVVNLLEAMRRGPGLSSGDVLLAVTTLSFDIAALELFLPLLVGARLVVVSRETAADGAQLHRLLEASGATVIQATPATWRLLQEAGWTGTDGLRIWCGGEALLPELGQQLRELGAAVWNLYGPTETTIWSSAHEVTEVDAAGASVSIGRPLANTQLYVLDKQLRPVPMGVVGELYIGGDGLARGYLGQAGLTAEKFVPHPFGEAGARMYRTGDLARYLGTGALEYVGRVDQQVKVRGYRIEVGEIEVALSAHEAVREGVVVARAGADGEKRLVAYVVAEGVETRALQQHLSSRLPAYMVPSVFVMLEQLPLTPNGKVDRRALPAPELGRLGEEYVAARTPSEEVLAGIWATVLRVEQVGVYDNFFALGGHSLLATQVMSRVREAFGVEVPVRALFEHPTISGLTGVVEELRQGGAGLEAPALLATERSGELVLSYAQQRLWFLDQLEPGSNAYNIPTAVRLKGVLHVAALEQSFAEVICRHESLRTRFAVVVGVPVQVIDEVGEFRLQVTDLSELGEREAEARRLARAEAQEPFDLVVGPLFRARVLRLGAEDHVLLCTMHHIVSDGWSMGILIRELTALYEAFTQGQPSPLPELTIQYADFAQWQRGWLQGEVLERQLNYWKQQLDGAPAALELPTDYVRPAVQSFRGAQQAIVLSSELTAGLKELSRREGVTLFMTVLAGWQLLLSRYSGQKDIVVGTAIAGRNRAETEALIGFFVNTLVLRTALTGDPSFVGLLGRVREVALGAYAHQDVPFEKLVEELQPERDLSRSPLFQVLLLLQNAPQAAAQAATQLRGLELSAVAGEAGAEMTVKYDLTLELTESGAGLVGTLGYNVELFTAETIGRMVRHLELLFEQVVQQPEQRLSELELVSAAEREQLLVQWNETAAEYPAEQCVHELFEAQVARTPEAIAVVHEAEALTYAELNARANQLAHYLQTLGVGAETLVGICVERSVAMMVGLLGILKAGGAYVPLDPSYPQERLAYMLADAQLTVLLTQTQLLEALPQHEAQTVCLDAASAELEWQSTANPRPSVTPNNLAYVIYTSGSTGRPKGVQIAQRGVVNLLEAMRRGPGLDSDDVLLAVTTLSFDIAALELFLPLLVGARLVVVSRETAADGAQLHRLLEASGATVMQATPATWRLLQEAGWTGTDGLRIWCGGEALLPELGQQLRELGAAVWNLYGPTETTIWSSAHEVTEIDAAGASVSIGRPLANTQLYVLDGQLRPLPVGVVGELYIGGDGLARGYLGQAGLTAEKFVPHPFGEAGARMYRTGDLARYLGTGALEYVGRVDQQVKVRGYRIEVGEIEVALNAHEAVREAVVVARAGADGEKRLVAYVVAEGVETRELQQYVSSRLPAYMVPSAFVMLEQLPLTPNGKVDRRALPAPELGRAELGGEYVAARTPSEEVLAGIWATVLRVEKVGVYDNFFALGGHSLLATQVMSRVREAFTVEVPVRALFEHPTVQALANVIDEAKLSEGGLAIPPIVRVSREEELPLSFAQQRQWILDQLDPDSSAYLIPTAIRLRGKLDVAALERTFSEILNRHETLRTNFEVVAGRPVQVIRPPQPLTLRVTDLRGHDDSEREARRLVVAEAKRPFDLARDQLLRVSLLQLEDDHYVLLCTMHHIASDGWSIGVLVKEITTLYTAFRAGKPSPLPELTIQYADFAHWQQNWFQGEVLDKQLDYWKRQLDQVPVLLLPTDRLRPAMQSFDGAAQGIVLNKDLTRRIKALSQREGSTLFMVLLATFQTLLSRYARQDDISVGTFIANRNRADIEGLVGFFVNNLTLRTDLSGDPTVRELLRRVRNVTLGAYAHQDLPFEKVLEAVQPDRDLSRTPLFQVMFVLQNAPSEAMELGDLTFSPLSEGTGARANFDITFWMSEVNEELAGSFQYSTALFDASTMTRMAGHFQTLIESILDHPDALLSELSILTDAERQLSEDWNDTARDYPRDGCLHELFEMQVDQRPNAIAVIYEDEQLTYAELNKRANRLAHHLIGLGVGPDVRVGICVEPSIEMVVGLFAILKAGGAYVPLDPSYPKERLSFVLDDTDALVLLTQERLLAKLPKHRARVVCIDTDAELLAQRNDTNPASGVTPENMSYIIFTSGSTGTPKGVMVSHKGIVNCILWMQSILQLDEHDRWMTKASLSFDASVAEIFWPLIVGSGLVVARPGGGQDSAYVVRTIIRHEVTVVHFVASMLIPFMDQRELPEASSLKHLFCGGEALPLETMQRFHERSSAALINFYGPTEGSLACTSWRCERESEVVPIGRPGFNTQAHVLDQNLRPVPIGVPGELHIGGRGVARGYLNRPELTAEKFIPDPFSDQPGARLYKTGDLVRYLPDGNLDFLGRIDSQVKVRGFRIELGEVEAALRQHASVREAVVCAREDTPGDQRLVAYVIAEHEQRPKVSELRLFMKKTLPEYLVPSDFVLLDEFPLNRSGKLDRSALPAPGHDRPELEEGYVAARSPIEEKLTAIWKEVLRVDQVGVHDNFFDLSGHSLQATQMISRAQKVFCVEIPLRALFDSPTVSAFAEYVEKLLEDGQSSTVALVPGGRNRELLSYAQQRLWFLDQMSPGIAAYNVPSAMRLRGTLDIPALTRSLNEIIRRHESLRTTFEGGDGEPVQVIARAASLVIPVVEASEMQRLIREEAVQPFDLARGPLLRAKLLRVAEDDHVLLLTLHHIICDGWSIGVFTRELAALYEAYASGRESSLAKLPVQYADYARWQREWLQGEVLERQLSYWKEQLAGAPAVLELPTDRPRPSAQSFRGQQQIVRFSPELSQALNAFSREEGVTLFMTILGAFQTLLFRYSGQDDIVVGSPIANRNHAELEPLIGFFANTLAMRTDLSGDPSFRELLRRVKEMAVGAYAHQDVPFEKLVEELQPERSLSHSPLFQVMLVLQNAPGAQLQLPGVSLETMPVETATVKFDLTLLLTEAEQGLEGRLEYNTDLFDAGTIARMVDHFEVLVESVVSNPEQRLSELELLTAAEREQLLVEWNHATAAYPDRSIHELFEEQVRIQPDALAVMYADARLSYAELNERANQLAHYLQNVGVGPEVIVGLCVERSVEMVVGLLGILKAGGAYLPLEPSYPRERLAFMLADAEVTVLLTQTHLRDSFETAHVLCLDAAGPLLAGYPVSNPATKATGDNLAYVIYTSGSTGRPKGVLIRRRALTNLGYGLQEAIYQQLGCAGGLRVSVNAPLVFDASVKQLVQLGWGHTLCVIPDEVRGDGEALLAHLAAEQVEVLDATPAQVQLLLAAAGRSELGAVRAVLVGGEAIDESLWALMSGSETTQYYNVYGPTECTVDTTTRRVEGERASLGHGLGNVDVYILDQGLKLAPVGVAGELCVGGAGLARCYLNRPELTAEKFIPHPYSTDAGARLYRTGDVARYRSDGALEYVGRVDHQVKVRGYRIELGEIEAALLRTAQVREAVVVVGEAQQLVAYVVCVDGPAPTSDELRAQLQGQLPDYMAPSQYVLLERLPLTPSGKVDRRALPAPDNTRPELRNIFAPPQTDTEKNLAAIWQEVLRVDRIGIHDNFFDLGGHSLLATQVISRVRKSFQVEVGLRSLFESPTVFGLALVVKQSQDEQTGRLADVIDQIETVDENNLLTKIEELSDEDVALLLSDMLAEAEVIDE